MTGVAQDLRYALRQFHKSPGFILTAALTTPQDPEGSFSYFEYQTLAQRMPAFSGLAAVGAGIAVLQIGGSRHCGGAKGR